MSFAFCPSILKIMAPFNKLEYSAYSGLAIALIFTPSLILNFFLSAASRSSNSMPLNS
jgi:hypothetical protein